MPKTLFIDREDPILRAEAREVLMEEIGTKKLEKILEKMKRALHGEDDGVAIAAPQIGESLRIFIVRGSAIALAKNKKEDHEQELNDLVFINPAITKTSQKKKKMEEGCLSLRYLYGNVLRHEKITLKAINEMGEKVTVGASGLLAQIFQHELDHLNGVLFIDKAEDVKDLPPTNSHA